MNDVARCVVPRECIMTIELACGGVITHPDIIIGRPGTERVREDDRLG